MFWFQKKVTQETYNPAYVQPVIRASICNGEKVAGFRNRKTGHFTEDCLIQSEQDLRRFREKYGIQGEIEEIY